VIAFWPRYLLLITPFFVLLVVKFLFEHRVAKVMTVLFFPVLIGQTLWLFSPQPHRAIAGFYAHFEDGLFQDLYFQLSSKSRPKGTSSDFWRKNIQVRDQLAVYENDVAVAERFVWPWEMTVRLPMRVTYHTNIGEVAHKTELLMRREHGKWVVDWEWGYLLPGYRPEAVIEKVLIEARQGNLQTESGEILSRPSERQFVYALPGEVTDYDAMEHLLAPIVNENRFMISKKLKENSPADRWVGLGFVWHGADRGVVATVCRQKAVRCVTLIDRSIAEKYVSSEKVQSVLKLEKKYAAELRGQNGGQIALRFPDQSIREVYSRAATDGHNVIVSGSDILGL
jgi:hypothetical protein